MTARPPTALHDHRSRRLGRWAFGDYPFSRLVQVHVLSSAAESFFAVSLAGSLFFNVTVDAARPRILLYLALTLAPFAVIAPLIGPFIDRVPGGLRQVALATLVGRAAFSVALANHLRSLLLYPEAFAMIVLARTYALTKNALVPGSVRDPARLVAANSHLARAATFSTWPAGLLAVACLRAGDAELVLEVGAVVYAVGAVAALRLPRPAPDPSTPPPEELSELASAPVRSAAAAMATLRAAVGFIIFHLGFELKASGEPAWFFGAVVLASGIGGFAGTFLAPWMRRHWTEQTMLTLSLAGPAVIALVAGLRFHRVTVLAAAGALGLGASVGRRAFDSVVQVSAPHARRARAYARLDTGLELAWVVGALAAVISRAVGWLGMVVLAAWMGGVAVSRLAGRLTSTRLVDVTPLPVRLLRIAEEASVRGDHEVAVMTAAMAADAVPLPAGEGDDGDDDGRRRTLDALRRAATGEAVISSEEALRLAAAIIGHPPR